MKTVRLLFLTGFVITASCNTIQEDLVEASPDLYPELVAFPSAEDFTNFMLSTDIERQAFLVTEQKAGFVPYSEVSKSHSTGRGAFEEDLQIPDETLASIFNADGVIKIGSWFILLDKPKERVLALHESNYNTSYHSLLSQDMSDYHIMSFSTDDEVLVQLADNNLNKRGPLGRTEICSAPSNKDTYNAILCPGNEGGAYARDTFIAYNKYGVWFQLKYQTKAQFKDLVWIDVPGTIGVIYDYSYYVNCSGNEIADSGSPTFPNGSGGVKDVFYNSFRKLSTYQFTVTFVYTLNCSSTPISSKTLSIRGNS